MREAIKRCLWIAHIRATLVHQRAEETGARQQVLRPRTSLLQKKKNMYEGPKMNPMAMTMSIAANRAETKALKAKVAGLEQNEPGRGGVAEA